MTKFQYAMPDGLTDTEREILNAKRDACFDSIHNMSLRWVYVTDANNRRLFRLTKYSRPDDHCYLEAAISVIDAMDDHQFKNAIIGKENNEKSCSDDE